jgi:hypothetical protein
VPPRGLVVSDINSRELREFVEKFEQANAQSGLRTPNPG